MSTQSMVAGSDEDEHYLSGQLAHPNKSLRKSLDMESADSDSNPDNIAIARGHSTSTKRPQLPSQLDALTNSSAAAISLSGATMQEQIRISKNQAIEILHVLDAESMLEHAITEYINDVEASYSDSSASTATFPKLRAAWTREEDRLLMVGVRVYGPNTESWPRIAMLVPGRTNKSCRKRWFHSLDPSLHKGPWTSEEDALLRQRVMQFPAQWSRVAEGITGRTDDQCAKRWRESLDPEIDRGKWRPEEDRLLLEKYGEFGTQWQKIATYFHGRPGLHCRNRWRKIQRIISQKERKTGPITPNDLTETLAIVTESVNRRKTAQRSRLHQHQEIIDNLAPVSIGGSGNAKMSLKAQRRSQSQEQLFAASPLSAPADTVGPTMSFGVADHAAAEGTLRPHMTRNYNSQFPMSAGQPLLSSSPQESMGALFMPSEQQAASSSQHEASSAYRSGASGGAKRSASMLFSPTEEQRQRLKHLGLKLYGCAAAPEQCNVAFGDSTSLNSHLKLSHPQVACLIPSLNNGIGYTLGLQQGLELSAPNSDASDTAAGSVVGGAIATGAARGLKPYRCAMSDCNHTYKNVSGLEYHIFQSRKSGNHLLLESPGNKSMTDGPDGGPDSAMPDVVMAESNASVELLDSLIHGSAAATAAGNHAGSMGGALALTSPTQSGGMSGAPALQCVEVDCLVRFGSEYELRQHVATQHPRPIRRAIKPSNRANPGRNTPTEQLSPGASFWNTTTINDVLGAAAMESGTIGGVGPAAMSLGAMPTIPESGISTPVSQTMEAAVAMAAAMGYGTDQQALALTANSPGVGQPLLTRGGQAAHRRLMLQGISNQPFLQATAAPFLSAPALINANGGEPNIGSYFALGLNHAGTADSQQQQQQQHHAMTPSLFGASTVGNNTMSSESMDAAAASMMIEAMNQVAAASAAGNEGQLSISSAHLDSAAAHGGDGVNDAALASNYLHDVGGAGMDNMSLNMQLMHSMMGGNPLYMPPHDGDAGNIGDGGGDVNMDGQQTYSRSQRSDSFDLSSVATVPNSGSSSSTIQPSAMPSGDAVDSLVTMSTGSKSGAHSQIAAALMSKRSWQQQQQQQLQQQVPAAVSSGHAPASAAGQQQQPGLLPWTHGFSALGLLPFSSDSQNRQAMSDGFPQPQHQQRFYTPQPTDLAQFHQPALQSRSADIQQPASATAPNSAGPRYQRQFVSTLQLGQLQHQPPPLYSSNSIIPCPVLGCRQEFTDANALKHHLSYDHPRDALTVMSANASNPGSPMEGFLSTMPTNNQTPMFNIATGPMSASAVLQPRHHPQGMPHLDPAAGPGTATADRSKAPHWIDTNTWSAWIAAANGQGDVTAAAAATAMGITPGINGPQAFLPAASTPLTQPAYPQQHTATNELLQMFQSVNRADT
ncbi:hypothetical protein GGI20_000497 [Coemansia sp. BCRC 34301]|nr:hypothetical protein GGI20_000497 [Coemansia sp. BCRC 34301]